MLTERGWSRWSGRGVVSYEVQPQVLIYAGVARGFKGGDFNGGALFAPTEANITGPEYVTSFEAGVKAVLDAYPPKSASKPESQPQSPSSAEQQPTSQP